MGILDVCIKSGKHIATIMLLCEDGKIIGEKFGFEDIAYIAGYAGVAFRIRVRVGGEVKDYITRRIELIGGLQKTAKFRVEKGDEKGREVTVPVTDILEMVSQE